MKMLWSVGAAPDDCSAEGDHAGMELELQRGRDKPSDKVPCSSAGLSS